MRKPAWEIVLQPATCWSVVKEWAIQVLKPQFQHCFQNIKNHHHFAFGWVHWSLKLEGAIAILRYGSIIDTVKVSWWIPGRTFKAVPSFCYLYLVHDLLDLQRWLHMSSQCTLSFHETCKNYTHVYPLIWSVWNCPQCPTKSQNVGMIFLLICWDVWIQDKTNTSLSDDTLGAFINSIKLQGE